MRTTLAVPAETPEAHPPVSRAAEALRDIAAGARASELWGLLGWQDIRQRYRRSTLGPFWLTISMGVLVAGLGILYAGLFKAETAEYLPFVAVGFIVWGLISGAINDGCMAFIGAESIVRQIGLPLSIHVYRVVWRNAIILAHNAVIYAAVAVIFALRPGWAGLLALPGLAFICLNAVWAALLIGLVSARFRDVPQIVASIVQMAFFLTPIIWMPEHLPDRAVIALEINPFYHFMEIVRAPLLGRLPALDSWLAVFGMTVAGGLLTWLVYARYRWRIVYWV